MGVTDQPAVPPESRIQDIARFFASPRSFDGKVGRLLSLDELTAEERAAEEELLQELTRLRAEALDAPGRPGARRPLRTSHARSSQSFGAGPYRFQAGERITIVCGQVPDKMLQKIPYTDPLDPDFIERRTGIRTSTRSLSLFGHLRAANPASRVEFRTADKLII